MRSGDSYIFKSCKKIVIKDGKIEENILKINVIRKKTLEKDEKFMTCTGH